jgi:hypothetical protein
MFRFFICLCLLYLCLVAYEHSKTPEPEVVLPKIEMPNPKPDSSREVDSFDWNRMEWKYTDQRHIKIRSSKIYQQDGEVQLIIEGKRYRVQHQGDGSQKLILIH